MIDADTVISAAALIFDLAEAVIRGGHGRHQRLVQARQAIATILHDRGYTLEEIGAVIRRDHTTVSYHLRQARQLLDRDPTFAARFRALRAAVDLAELPLPVPPPTPRVFVVTPVLRLWLWGQRDSIAAPLTA